ncbi:MAG: ATP-binding protein [Lachnospiraceae bacterium]|nr:ATP-binding protein [Lachnospiraceae bacterium]
MENKKKDAVTVGMVSASSFSEEEQQTVWEVKRNLFIAMRHAGMLYWEYDILTGMVYVNEMSQEWFGLPEKFGDYPESYLKMGFVAEDSIPLYREAVRRIQNGSEYEVFDACVRTLQQRYEWMRVRFTGLKSADGTPVRAICTAERIAEYKELESRFTTILHQNNIANWKYDIARHTIILNKSTYYAFSRNQEGEIADIPESQIREKLCHPDDVEILRRLYRRLDEGEHRVEETLRFIDSRSREYRWKKCIYTVVEDGRGKLTYALGSSVDITEQVETRQKYEAAVEYRERTQRENLVLSAHCSVTQNRVLEITDLTRSELLQRFGCEREGFFLGLESLIVDGNKRKEYHAQFSSEAVERNFELGIHEAELTCEICVEPGRKRQWVTMHLDMVKVPETSQIEGFLLVTDVTTAHVQEQILNTVVECDYDYVASISLAADTIALFQKNARDPQIRKYISGRFYSYRGFVTDVLQLLVIEQDRKFVREHMHPKAIREALQQDSSYEFVFHVRDEEGAIRTKRARFASFDRQGDTVVYTRTDVTDVLARQEELNRRLQASAKAAQEANQAKSVFLSRVSHDMRTPLNGILGLASLMKEKTDWAEIQKDITQLELSGEYLLKVINDTLDVSKIENGRMELQPSVCDSKAVMEATLAIQEPNLKENSIVLRTHMKNTVNAMLYIDVGRVQQLFTNIFGNSIKFTPAAGFIDFTMETLEETPEYIRNRFRIKDTGIGMKPEFIPHLFEPFSQEDTARTSIHQGTGLGMSIAKQIVTLMDGTISVKSEPGKGTEFVFTLKLPRATDEQIEQWERSRQAVRDFSVLKGKKILLCEDHPLNAQIAIRLLMRKEIQTEWAKDGQDGLTRFQNSPDYYYDLILMDIRMPTMDGLETTRRIRDLERPDAGVIPIVAMTANALSEDVEECKKAGMNAHIAKPIEPEAMYETIASLLE